MAVDLSQLAQDWAKPLGQIFGGPAAGAAAVWLFNKKQRKAAEVKASADQTDAVTRRIEAIFNGYESRIKDLTTEIERLQTVVSGLQEQLKTPIQSFGL